MIIGFDGSRAFRKEKTGTENYSYQLLKALVKIDRKNQYIIYTRPLTKYGTAVTKIVNKFPKNFTFRLVNWPRLWTQGGLAWQTFKDQIDVLFVPAHTIPLIRKPGLKTVVTVHDLGSEYLPSLHQVKQRLYLSFMQKYQLKTTTRIIAVSKATKEDLVTRIGIDRDKITVVYEGFDKELFKPVKGDILVDSLKDYGLKPGEYFLFVGTLQPRKNLVKLIQSFNQFCHPEGVKQPKDLHHNSETSSEIPRFARNDNVRLVIAGSRGWLSDEIYSLPKKLRIEDKVKFLGYVPDKNLPALYSGAIALTFPSLFEGFGLPILEAQACGCPVITSDVSSMPEVGGKGALYVNPYSIEDIIKGMVEVQSSKFKVQSLVKSGLENVKRFSWEKCAAQTLLVFEEIRSTKH